MAKAMQYAEKNKLEKFPVDQTLYSCRIMDW
jgi:hypothetical protein